MPITPYLELRLSYKALQHSSGLFWVESPRRNSKDIWKYFSQEWSFQHFAAPSPIKQPNFMAKYQIIFIKKYNSRYYSGNFRNLWKNWKRRNAWRIRNVFHFQTYGRCWICKYRRCHESMQSKYTKMLVFNPHIPNRHCLSTGVIEISSGLTL